jgi:hypothetical protein
MYKKERNIWKNLGLALAATPITCLIGLIIITLVGALDDAITKIQLIGYWWLVLVMAYILSLIYFIYESKIRKNIEREKIIGGLILYWKEQLEKQGKDQPSNEEIKWVHNMLLERFKIWAWFDPKLWDKYFPDEKYSKYLFDIVNNFMIYFENQKNKYIKK